MSNAPRSLGDYAKEQKQEKVKAKAKKTRANMSIKVSTHKELTELAAKYGWSLGKTIDILMQIHRDIEALQQK